MLITEESQGINRAGMSVKTRNLTGRPIRHGVGRSFRQLDHGLSHVLRDFCRGHRWCFHGGSRSGIGCR